MNAHNKGDEQHTQIDNLLVTSQVKEEVLNTKAINSHRFSLIGHQPAVVVVHCQALLGWLLIEQANRLQQLNRSHQMVD